MKGVYENTDEASPFRRRPDFDLLHLKNGAQDTLPVSQSVYQIKGCAGQFYFCRNWVTEVSGDAKCAPKVRKSIHRAPLVGNTEIVLPVRDLQSRRSKDGLQCFRRSKGSWGDSATRYCTAVLVLV